MPIQFVDTKNNNIQHVKRPASNKIPKIFFKYAYVGGFAVQDNCTIVPEERCSFQQVDHLPPSISL